MKTVNRFFDVSELTGTGGSMVLSFSFKKLELMGLWSRNFRRIGTAGYLRTPVTAPTLVPVPDVVKKEEKGPVKPKNQKLQRIHEVLLLLVIKQVRGKLVLFSSLLFFSFFFPLLFLNEKEAWLC
jgi:hypothetical protein